MVSPPSPSLFASASAATRLIAADASTDGDMVVVVMLKQWMYATAGGRCCWYEVKLRKGTHEHSLTTLPLCSEEHGPHSFPFTLPSTRWWAQWQRQEVSRYQMTR
jgi:hypothetical protein